MRILIQNFDQDLTFEVPDRLKLDTRNGSHPVTGNEGLFLHVNGEKVSGLGVPASFEQLRRNADSSSDEWRLAMDALSNQLIADFLTTLDSVRNEQRSAACSLILKFNSSSEKWSVLKPTDLKTLQTA